MNLKANILANYIGAGVVSLAPVLAMPWYLAALGPKLFGLISFIILLLAILGLLDAGVSQALVREIAAHQGTSKLAKRRTAVLLFGLERIYWAFAISVGLIMIALANVISNNWLNLDELLVQAGREAIYGAALIFMLQFPGALYRSVLVGAQAQIELNAIMLAGSILRHGGGVVLVSIWPELLIYLIWYAGIGLAETLVRGTVAWKAIGMKRYEAVWCWRELRVIFGTVMGISGAVWIGSLTVQLDKIILSKMVSIEQFGYYAIAASVSMGALQLVYPLIQAILPRAVQLRNDPIALHDLYIKSAQSILCVIGVFTIIYLTGGMLMLELWLQQHDAVVIVYPILSFLLIGAGFNALYNIGYVNWIVFGKVRSLLKVNLMSLGISLLIIPPLVKLNGTIGASSGWVVVNLVALICSIGWLKK